MLDQASIAQYKNGSLKSDKSYLVITMRFYPRFLRKDMRDEFICELAPVKELLHDFNTAQKRVGHNLAFPEISYESRFILTPRGLEHLKRLAELSKFQDVYLACVCQVGQMCHREILMLAAKKRFGCEIGKVFHDYPVFMERFNSMH